MRYVSDFRSQLAYTSSIHQAAKFILCVLVFHQVNIIGLVCITFITSLLERNAFAQNAIIEIREAYLKTSRLH